MWFLFKSTPTQALLGLYSKAIYNTSTNKSPKDFCSQGGALLWRVQSWGSVNWNSKWGS
jgi:hypothetical protein